MNTFNPNRLYKNPKDGRFMGVCAGVADYFDIRPGIIRLLTIVAFFMTGIFPTVFVYVLLGFVLEEKPEEIIEDPEEEKFWQKARTKPAYTKVEMQSRYDDIEKRTRHMEAYLTSKQFKLNRELRELED
ncbi:MAG: envelope stress response membrane protein PspC [Sphingomonadales bacterium]|nr:envelope stress response membrane protein PspC [Sphingomonadales bacterium]